VLVALHVPYALALSILVGVLDLIPLVGSTVGGVIVALAAVSTHVVQRQTAAYGAEPNTHPEGSR